MDTEREESAPKRRRTSPRLSQRASSEDAPTQQTLQSSPRRKRPSFASPTKASMSRFNPEILERRRSASPPKQPSPSRLPVPTRATPALGDSSRLSVGGSQLAAVPEDPVPSELARGSANPTQDEDTTADPGRRRARGGLAAAPRRSLPRPSPRPFPQPGPEDEDEDLNPFLGRTLRRSPETGISIPPPPEPELPPSVDDGISSTPPRGIHSSSPGRIRHSKPVSSSPLKRPPLRPDENDTQSSLFSKKPQKPKFAKNRPGRPKALQERSVNVRNVPAFDPLGDKKRRRDELQEELEKLRRDLGQAERENERIRVMQASARTATLGDEDATLDLVKKYLMPEEDASQPAQSQLLAKAALDPLALLPFAGRPAPILLNKEEDGDVAEVKSHHPVSMTAEEELPFLQLFSPFNVSAQLAMLPSQGNDRRQQHTINLTSRHVPGLFHARIEVVTDPIKLRVLSLKVPALDPAARAELEPFVEKVCSGQCNRSMQANCGIITWAMGEWLRVAEHRARFWSQMQRELGSKEALVSTSRDARARRHRRGRDEDHDSGDSPLQTAELFALVGKQSLDVVVPARDGSDHRVSARLSWKIDFDWTGEAQSKVSALTGLPGKCKRARLDQQPSHANVVYRAQGRPEASNGKTTILVPKPRRARGRPEHSRPQSRHPSYRRSIALFFA
jgi:hypothetical protein